MTNRAGAKLQSRLEVPNLGSLDPPQGVSEHEWEKKDIFIVTILKLKLSSPMIVGNKSWWNQQCF